MRKYVPGDKFVIELDEEVMPGSWTIKGCGQKKLMNYHLDNLVRINGEAVQDIDQSFMDMVEANKKCAIFDFSACTTCAYRNYNDCIEKLGRHTNAALQRMTEILMKNNAAYLLEGVFEDKGEDEDEKITERD